MSDTTEKRRTSAEIKREIEEASKQQRESKIKLDLKESGMPLVSAVASEINAIGSTTETSPQAGSKTEPAQPPAQPASERAAAESVELKEWAKKKGINWETEESVLSELRKRDQEFHRKQAERKAREATERPPVAPAWTPPPAYQPNFQGNPGVYAPPPPRAVIENLARQYQMTPEDVERLATFNRDFFEAMMGRERQRQAQELETLKNENMKNSIFRELSADPVFRRPEMALEFHNVLEEMQEIDPRSFEQDPSAYRRAYDKALANIGRRNLEGNMAMNGLQTSQLPTMPPRALGTGSGGGREEREDAISANEFARLPVDEQKKVLEKMGLVQSKY